MVRPTFHRYSQQATYALPLFDLGTRDKSTATPPLISCAAYQCQHPLSKHDDRPDRKRRGTANGSRRTPRTSGWLTPSTRICSLLTRSTRPIISSSISHSRTGTFCSRRRISSVRSLLRMSSHPSTLIPRSRTTSRRKGGISSTWHNFDDGISRSGPVWPTA